MSPLLPASRVQLELEKLPISLVLLSSSGQVLAATQLANELFADIGFSVGRLPPSLWKQLVDQSNEEVIELLVGTRRLGFTRYSTGENESWVLVKEVSEQHRFQVRRAHRQRLEAIGRLAASVAHDLRSPLSTIVLNARSLEAHVQGEDAGGKQLLSELQEASDRLRTAISHVLDAAQVGPRMAARVSLRAICERVAGYVRGEVRQRGHRLEVSIGTDACIEANPIAFEHIVSSLVMNAIEASEEPIKIYLEAGLVARGEIEPTRVEGASVAWIRVRDEGPGIPNELSELVFEPAFSTKAEGSGLGLTLARDFARERKGDLILEQTESGASFVVLFPVMGAAE